MYIIARHQKGRIKSHVFEKVIQAFMFLFGIGSVTIAVSALKYDRFSLEMAIILMLIIMILLLLSQTVVLIRIYEQHEE